MVRVIFFVFVVSSCALTITAGMHYKGDLPIYLLFTFLANALLLNGFRKRAIYFDTFIGVFLWLGFWLKFSYRIAFSSGRFHELVGGFDGSATSFDHALIVSSSGIAACLVASVIRERFFFYTSVPPVCTRSGLFLFYQSCRKRFVGIFCIAVLFLAACNVWLGIYQRGMVTQTVLPYGLNGLFKWLLQFGFASVSALIIRFEIALSQNFSLMLVLPAILESFLSSVSLLSRGMILNSSALTIAALHMIRATKRRLSSVAFLMYVGVFVSLFAVSVVTVNYLRATTLEYTEATSVTLARDMASPLFIDRWVGIEGVLAVSSSHSLGWGMWREAWQEKYQENQLSLYDRTFVDSPYAQPGVDMSKHHFVTMPGIIAFLYYPGSFAFLFFSMFFCALAAAALEIITYHFCGKNWILCSLFAQVIAYRYVSFGYVPGQSYLLFGTLILNGFLIFTADYLFCLYFTRRRQIV